MVKWRVTRRYSQRQTQKWLFQLLFWRTFSDHCGKLSDHRDHLEERWRRWAEEMFILWRRTRLADLIYGGPLAHLPRDLCPSWTLPFFCLFSPDRKRQQSIETKIILWGSSIQIWT
jgi:hypothetical protein